VCLLVVLGSARAQDLEPKAPRKTIVGTSLTITAPTGHNSDFYTGGLTRSPDRVVTLQGHGASVDGGAPAGVMSNSRLGAISFPMGRQQALKVAASSGVALRAGTDFKTLSVGWQWLRFTRR
jgi:hypothetical protein